MKKSLFLLVRKLLSENKIPFDKKELAFQIESHPSYPSLHAITGVLDHFNIENIAAEVPVNLETLLQLPDTFIGQIQTQSGKDLVTISKLKNKKQYNLFSNSKNEVLTEAKFLEKFTGIIVAVEKDETKQDVKNNRTLIEVILFAVLCIATSLLLITRNIGIANIIFIIISIIGVVASLSILKQELGESSIIGDAFCSGYNEKKDCDAVLTSKGAAIIKGHKLSDLSVIYFSGLLISSLLMKNFNLLYLISFLALPITFYSIFYQYKVVKSWCTLCLSIVALLWLNGIVAATQVTSFSINFYDLLMVTASFVVVYMAWMYIKPLVKEVTGLKKEKITFIKFKRNFNLFESLLQTSNTLNTAINSSEEIILGNKNASLQITVITNPFCGHCKPVHNIVNDILNRYSEAVKIVIRFNVHISDTASSGVQVTAKLLELYNQDKTEDCKKAMDDIYEGMEVKKWLSKWNKVEDLDQYFNVLKMQKDWCNTNAINFTPAILINGKSFPKEYDRTDLIFFIEDLEELYSKNPIETYS